MNPQVMFEHGSAAQLQLMFDKERTNHRLPRPDQRLALVGYGRERDHRQIVSLQKRSVFVFLLFVFAVVPAIQAQKGGQAPAQGQAGGGAGGAGGTPFFETQMLAYGAVNQLSETIVQQVCAMNLAV